MTTSANTTTWGQANGFKRKLILVSYGLAIVVVIGVAAAFLTEGKQTSSGTTVAPRPLVAVAARPAGPELVTYYIVASEEEAARGQALVDQDAADRAAAETESTRYETYFLAIDTPEKEATLKLMVEDLNAIALQGGTPQTRIIDVRAR